MLVVVELVIPLFVLFLSYVLGGFLCMILCTMFLSVCCSPCAGGGRGSNSAGRAGIKGSNSAGGLRSVWVAGLFPLRGPLGGVGRGVVPAVELAVQHVNRHPSVLPGVRLQVAVHDTQVGGPGAWNSLPLSVCMWSCVCFFCFFSELFGCLISDLIVFF